MADKQVRQLPDEFLNCRFARHQWEVIGKYRSYDKVGKRSKAGYQVVLMQCKTCDTIREDYLLGNGEKDFHTYQYAEDYQLKRPKGQRTKSEDVRAEMLRRLPMSRKGDLFE